MKNIPFPGQAPATWVQPPALNQKVQARVGGTQLEVLESSSDSNANFSNMEVLQRLAALWSPMLVVLVPPGVSKARAA